MQLPRKALLFVAAAVLSSPVNGVGFDCEHIRADETSFDLLPLSGPFSIHELYKTATGAVRNRTFTIDICQPLTRSSGKAKEEECPNGSRVCALERIYSRGQKSEPRPDDVWPIAGHFEHEGRDLNAKATRLKGSESHADADREGLRLVLEGGVHENVKQRASIEFICDRNRTGLEGHGKKKEETKAFRSREGRRNLWRLAKGDEDEGGNEGGDEKGDKGKKGDGKHKGGEADDDRDRDGGDGREDGGDDEDGELPQPDAGQSLQLVSYSQTSSGKEEVGTLRLEWRTKYACENIKETDPDPPAKKKGNWGFFTWFIIVLFLVVAAYLIFGSWLNYSRHGARGWDLLPHGDTIRDVPYLFKEWARNMISMVRSGGSRGGYNTI